MAALGFTPASGQDVFSIETKPSRCKKTSALGGEEARQFYENLMTDDKEHCQSASVNSRKNSARSHYNRRKSRVSSRRLSRVRAVEMQRGETHSAVQHGNNGEGSQRSETSNSERSMELKGLRLLRCAHEGDVSGLKDLISKGVNINFQVQ